MNLQSFGALLRLVQLYCYIEFVKIIQALPRMKLYNYKKVGKTRRDSMLKKSMKPMTFILLAFVIIVIGDDETRLFLKRTAKKMLKRETGGV